MKPLAIGLSVINGREAMGDDGGNGEVGFRL